MARSTAELRRLWAPACSGPSAAVDLYGAGTWVVRPAVVDAVRALNSCLVRANYPTRQSDTGAYNCRPITGGSGYSLHAYKIAGDINWRTNPYGDPLVTDMPASMIAAIKAIRTRNGAPVWRWGGDYTTTKDAMHFEVIASPAEIATGIDPATVWPDPVPPAPPPVVVPPYVDDDEEDSMKGWQIIDSNGRVVLFAEGGVVVNMGGKPTLHGQLHASGAAPVVATAIPAAELDGMVADWQSSVS